MMQQKLIEQVATPTGGQLTVDLVHHEIVNPGDQAPKRLPRTPMMALVVILQAREPIGVKALHDRVMPEAPFNARNFRQVLIRARRALAGGTDWLPLDDSRYVWKGGRLPELDTTLTVGDLRSDVLSREVTLGETPVALPKHGPWLLNCAATGRSVDEVVARLPTTTTLEQAIEEVNESLAAAGSTTRLAVAGAVLMITT